MNTIETLKYKHGWTSAQILQATREYIADRGATSPRDALARILADVQAARYASHEELTTQIKELQAQVENLERVLAHIADYEVTEWEPFATIEELQDIAANATSGIYPWSHSTEREAQQ